jgi:hypothetical protein
MGVTATAEAEQMSRDKYNEFTKLSRAFVRAYPNEDLPFGKVKGYSRSSVLRTSSHASVCRRRSSTTSRFTTCSGNDVTASAAYNSARHRDT